MNMSQYSFSGTNSFDKKHTIFLLNTKEWYWMNVSYFLIKLITASFDDYHCDFCIPEIRPLSA